MLSELVSATGLTSKVLRGVLGSLEKKDMIIVEHDGGTGFGLERNPTLYWASDKAINHAIENWGG